MAKKIKTITLSCVTVMVCLALLVVGTYALFSDQASMHNHLQAGNLKIELWRTKLESTILDAETGTLKTLPANTENVNFTNNTQDNLFGLDSYKIAPGCAFSADVKIDNKGDVAINWYLGFTLDAGEDNADLADQLKVTVVIGDETHVYTVSELQGLKLGSESDTLGFIGNGDSQTFTVTVEFVDSAASNIDFENNDAMDQELSFDITVYAIQATTAA